MTDYSEHSIRSQLLTGERSYIDRKRRTELANDQKTDNNGEYHQCDTYISMWKKRKHECFLRTSVDSHRSKHTRQNEGKHYILRSFLLKSSADSSVMKEEKVDVKSYQKKQNDEEEDLTKHSATSGDI